MYRQTYRVLLIEDDAEQAHLIDRILSQSQHGSFAVICSATLREALARLEQGGIDAVIVDLGLPDSEGLRSFDAIHAVGPSIPAIVITGTDDLETALEAVRRGAQDYIIKQEFFGPMVVRSLCYAIERKRLEEQLLQSQKMEAVGLLAGGIAHEFNNLLQTIQGFTRFAAEGISPDDDRYKYLDHVLNAADGAALLTRQLLDFSHRHDLEKSRFDLRDLVQGVARSIQASAQQEFELIVDLDDGEQEVAADPNMVEQLFMNLCRNSCDAMPDGGQLKISSRSVLFSETDSELRGLERPGHYAMLSVVDNGRGIPAEVQDRICEPFFTTKPPGKGTGLGLALAYSIAKQHGGVIEINSKVGKGTVVSVYLPLAEHRVPEQRSLGPAIDANESALAGDCPLLQ